MVAEVRGIINPVLAGYVQRVIDTAERNQAALVVLTLDTPGGLDTSMREISQRILGSKVPVAVFVSPRGARSASAGVFLNYAAHVSAMAPSTNIGSAHPVRLGEGSASSSDSSGVMMDKVVNDSVAAIRSTAELRGRNADWAELAIRESANLPASEALRLNVIDLIAEDVADLIRQIDGRSVQLAGGERLLSLGGVSIDHISMNPIEAFFHVIGDPTIAYLLLSLGGLALVYELSNPGLILPGVIGGMALLLSLYALGSLPVNVAALGLILFALLLLLADLALAGNGMLTVGGITSFALGSLLLTTSPESDAYVRVSLPAVLTMTTTLVGLFSVVAILLVRSHRKSPVLASSNLHNATGIAKTDVGASGTVLVAGELWSASAEDPASPIAAGQRILVVSVTGLRLTVRAS